MINEGLSKDGFKEVLELLNQNTYEIKNTILSSEKRTYERIFERMLSYEQFRDLEVETIKSQLNANTSDIKELNDLVQLYKNWMWRIGGIITVGPAGIASMFLAYLKFIKPFVFLTKGH